MSTFLVIDASVMVYTLNGDNVKNVSRSDVAYKYGVRGAKEFDRQVSHAYVDWLTSGEWLPPQLKGPDLIPIWVWDKKLPSLEYWRHSWLKAMGHYHIHYKAGRTEKPDSWYTLRDHMKFRVSQLGVGSLEFDGYEADDIAGAIVKLAKATGDKVVLLTVDTDWLGLISPKVSWVSSTRYAPQVRNNLESLNVWSQRRLNTTFQVAEELWEYKCVHGDPSDNLPPKSPKEVISLLNPPAEYDLAANGVFTLDQFPVMTLPDMAKPIQLLLASQSPFLAVEWLPMNDLGWDELC